MVHINGLPHSGTPSSESAAPSKAAAPAVDPAAAAAAWERAVPRKSALADALCIASKGGETSVSIPALQAAWKALDERDKLASECKAGVFHGASYDYALDEGTKCDVSSYYVCEKPQSARENLKSALESKILSRLRTLDMALAEYPWIRNGKLGEATLVRPPNLDELDREATDLRNQYVALGEQLKRAEPTAAAAHARLTEYMTASLRDTKVASGRADPSLEKVLRGHLKEWFAGEKLDVTVKSVTVDPESAGWEIERNGAGIITGRSRDLFAVFKIAGESDCRLAKAWVHQDYAGGGNYEAPGTGNHETVSKVVRCTR